MFKYIALAIAVACQFQIRAPVSEVGLMVNLADPIVAVLVAIAIIRFVSNPSIASDYRIPLLWAGGLSLVLSIGLIVSLGDAGTWGFLNRYVGWFVLLGYAGVGVWIVRENAWPAFRTAFVVTAGVIVLVHALPMLSNAYFLTSFSHELTGRQFVGFLGNPNAVSFFLLVVVGMVFCWTGQRRIYVFLILVVIFLGIAYSISRSGLVGLGAILIAALAIKRGALKPALGALAVCVALVLAPQVILDQSDGLMRIVKYKMNKEWDSYVGILRGKAPRAAALSYRPSSLQLRFDQTRVALDQWTDSPVFGIGLGGFKNRYQDPSSDGSAPILHNSALWLLTETGLVGLIAFLAAFIWIAAALYRQRRSGNDVIPLALLTLVVFAVMSQLHDLFYQRVLWLVIGLGIGGLAPSGIDHKRVASTAKE